MVEPPAARLRSPSVERKQVPARIALATERIAAEVGSGPGRLLELGSAGIHASALALLGWTVVVAEDDPDALLRARERADGAVTVIPATDLDDASFDVVVAAEPDHGARYLRAGGRLIEA